NYQETNNSVVQMDIVRVTGYGGTNKFVLQGRANVTLPRAEKSLHLLLESDPDKNTAIGPTQTLGILPVTNTTPESYGAGVRYEKSEEERWHFNTDGGLKFAGLNTAPFARMRGSYAVPIENWRLKAAETVFWFNTTGAGETTQVDLERTFSDPLLFRATSIATWLNNNQSFNLRQDFSVFQTLDERNAMQYQASAVGVSNSTTQVTDYVILTLYRHRLHRKWMFLEISPQLQFPRTRNFQASSSLTMRLEILFDKSR
ncbi:MAG TPA: hypothetical protein VKG67_02400, partial [Gallionellaceae bacterium]|nr:hypothetical protein [Gallionellaceae bacterium]